MKTKSLAIILVLAVWILAAGSAYSGGGPPGNTFGTPSAHPWEEPNNNNGPSPSSAMISRYDHRVIMIPIFSDFLIWIYIKDIRKGSDQQKKFYQDQ